MNEEISNGKGHGEKYSGVRGNKECQRQGEAAALYRVGWQGSLTAMMTFE